MRPPVHDLASIKLELNCIGSFGGGKNDPSDHQSFGGERKRKVLTQRRALDYLIAHESWFPSHQPWTDHGRIGSFPGIVIVLATSCLREDELEPSFTVCQGGKAIV